MIQITIIFINLKRLKQQYFVSRISEGVESAFELYGETRESLVDGLETSKSFLKGLQGSNNLKLAGVAKKLGVGATVELLLVIE